MNLSTDLIDQFVAATNDEKKESKETTVYGTVVKNGDSLYVQLDGSTELTPVVTTTNVEHDQRVSVLIKNHTATITGNLSDPSAGSSQMAAANEKILVFDKAIGKTLSVDELTATTGFIDSLISNDITTENISAVKADIEELLAGTITADDLKAKWAEIDGLDAGFADIITANIGTAIVNSLTASYAYVHGLDVDYGNFKTLTTERLDAQDAVIEDLEANKIDVNALDAKYANVEFANIGEAAIRKLFSSTGLIDNLVVGDGMIVSGDLRVVTLNADSIKTGTMAADRLMLKDSESGLYYQLNVNALGEAYVTDLSEEEQQELQNGIHGENIIANSITAKHIVADDLTAFGAAIANFKIVPASGVNLLTNESAEGEVTNGDYSHRMLTISNPDMVVSNGIYTLSFECDSFDESVAWCLEATVYDKDGNGTTREFITKFEQQGNRWVGTGRCPALSVAYRYDDITSTLTIEKGYYYNSGFLTKTKDPNGGVHCTNLIPVKTGDKFKITTTYGYAAVLVAEFDTTQTMVSYHGQVDGTAMAVTDYEYTVPSGVSYIAINNRYETTKPMTVEKEIIERDTLGADLQLRLLSEDPSKNIATSKVKLELGTQATNWENTPGQFYSDGKSSPENDTRGIYMDTDGQFAVGDSNNYVKFYNDDGTYKLALKTSRIELDSGKTVEEAVADSAMDVQNIGKNLFLNSGRLQNVQIGLEGAYDGIIIGSDTTAPSGNALSCVWNSAKNHVNFAISLPYQNYNNKIKVGDKVTVSMYLKFNRKTNHKPEVLCGFIDTHHYRQQPTLDTDWQRLVVTGTAVRSSDVLSAESSLLDIRLNVFNDFAVQAEDTFYFSSPKIELGDKVTAWTWATESDDTDIRNIVNAIDVDKSVSATKQELEDKIEGNSDALTKIEKLLNGEYDPNDEMYVEYKNIISVVNGLTGTEGTAYITDGHGNQKAIMLTEASGNGLIFDFANGISEVLGGIRDDAADAIALSGNVKIVKDEFNDPCIIIAPADIGCKLKLTADDVEFINSKDRVAAVLTSDEMDSLRTDNVTVDNELRHTYGGRNLLTQASAEAEVATLESHRKLAVHDSEKLEVGKKYTLSFEGTLPSDSRIWLLRVVAMNSDDSDAKFIDFITSFKQEGKMWYGTGKYPSLPSGYTYRQLRLYPYDSYNTAHPDEAVTRNVKLELGIKATEYSTAPEDTGAPSGAFVWEVRSNGNYGLSWKGD